VVEIDLLRSGEPLAEVTLDRVPPHLRTPYAAWVRRATGADSPRLEYYGIPLRQRLPRLRVPLRAMDADVRLDLQAAFDAAYEQGSYDLTDYDRPPEPPLAPDDDAWAQEQIAIWRASPPVV
jgi:hypothetical protein